MANSPGTIRLADSAGRLVSFLLHTDDKNHPLWKSEVLDPIQQTVQVGEATYAAFLPRRGGVYAQADLSLGIGKRFAVTAASDDHKRAYYTESFDTSIAGQAQKGPKVTALGSPSNSGALSAAFEVGGVAHLVLGRIIAKWNGTGNDTLTEVRDYGGGLAGSGAAVFSKLGTEAKVEESTGTGATADIDGPEDSIAQSFYLDDASILFLSKVEVSLLRTGTVTGDVRLRVFTDVNGAPGVPLVSARVLASLVDTSAETIYFRFDNDETCALPYGEPMWLVLDAIGATSTSNRIQWVRGTVSSYARGIAYKSADGGNTWAAYTDFDCVFALYAKTPTTTVYVGATTASKFLATTVDGASYTDTDRTASQLALVGSRLFRDVLTVGANGAIMYSDDGKNWSEAIVVGDPKVNITGLHAMGNVLIVCKADSIWAVDALDTLGLEQLQGGASVSTNGQGAKFWNGAVYVPFGGRLVAIEGTWGGGFDVYQDISLGALPEWDFPMGPGQVVAVVGDRHYLYAVMSATSGYRLFKSANPLKKEWHGSLATIGDGSQTIQFAYIFDAGGTASPELFLTTTANNVVRIRLSRTTNPAADTNYQYDIASTGYVYHPIGHGNLYLHQKGWLADAVTTAEELGGGDYVEPQYDLIADRRGYRRLGRLYGTGALPYPPRTASLTIARRTAIVNTAATTSPILLAFGLSFAVRSIPKLPMKMFTFSVLLEDGQTGVDLSSGSRLNTLAREEMLFRAADGGTRKLVDPWGRAYARTLVTQVDAVLLQYGAENAGKLAVNVQAVQIG